MKNQWTHEQLEEYDKMSYQGTQAINDKIVCDLLEAVKWITHHDYDTAFRLASGAVAALKKWEYSLCDIPVIQYGKK